MRRLLMYFSYIGTNYRGLQRISAFREVGTKNHDLDSVQGILEFGLKKVLWLDKVPIFCSSRTDTKVHAVESTATFDISDEEFLKKSKRAYSPDLICQSLNFFLDKNECDIKVNRIVEVPEGFNPRKAYSRVYEFRLAVLNDAPYNVSSAFRYKCCTDIRELNRCEVIAQPFDIEAVQEVCKLFVGKWNFSTYMKSAREVVPEEKRWKTIRRFSCARETFYHPDFDAFPEDLHNLPPYDVYTFTVEGSGFLRRQVRRMVGAIVGVGKGLVKPDVITYMLKNPSEQNWNNKLMAMGPNGLYLKKINYENVEVLRGYLG